MKKILLLAIGLAFVCTSADAVYKQGYYDKMDGKKKEALKAAAKECVEWHTRLVYTDLPNYWQYSDVYPDLYDGCKRWWDMYSDNIYLIRPGQNARSSFSANKMQREHSVPKSWWKKNGDVEYTPAYSDMWNLFPIRRTREPGQAQLSSRALQINDVQQRREQGGAGTDRLWRRFGQRV